MLVSLNTSLTFPLASGARATVRPLCADDARRLGQYFLGLSAETKRRFGPHPFDQATADQLCATLKPDDTLRLIATCPAAGDEQVIAYFIVQWGVTSADAARYAQRQLPLDPQADCTVAPSVADAFQNQQVGSPIMRHALHLAQHAQRRRMVLLGGTQATNTRALHFYAKHGFKTLGQFEHPAGVQNYDMARELHD